MSRKFVETNSKSCFGTLFNVNSNTIKVSGSEGGLGGQGSTGGNVGTGDHRFVFRAWNTDSAPESAEFWIGGVLL